MAISIFPAPVTSSLNASSITATTALTAVYEGRATFLPAVYTVTCASGVVTNFEFLSGAGPVLTSGVTVSGTVSVVLASTADRIRVWTNTGSNTVITITQISAALTDNFPGGTLDTITTTSTYTGTSTSGYGYAILVGGGGGGGGSASDPTFGSGGGAGGVGGKLVALTGSMSVVIGAGGLAGAANGGTGGTGGTSTFAGITCTGGTGGQTGSTAGAIGTVTGADYVATGGRGGRGNIDGGEATTKILPFVKNGTTGGGGEGTGSSGAGSGIGTGGRFEAGTGYGSGGGGGANSQPTRVGYAGAPGVLYVLRF